MKLPYVEGGEGKGLPMGWDEDGLLRGGGATIGWEADGASPRLAGEGSNFWVTC